MKTRDTGAAVVRPHDSHTILDWWPWEFKHVAADGSPYRHGKQAVHTTVGGKGKIAVVRHAAARRGRK